ncbi:MAG: MG2 domain-containing protein, partial [Acidobacteriota bacterium]
MKKLALSVVLVFLSLSARAASLSVVKAGPVGETDSIAEANEVRVIFSEPMVKVGKSPATAPWFHITPELKGTIRWSGTTTLIFTPEPRLPFATKYDVTIDDTVKSVAGSKLDRAYAFSFTTPTIKLLRTDWYRRDGKADGAVVIAIWFNQPIDAAMLVQHLQLRTRTHDWTAPVFTPDGRKRLETLEPQALGAFEAKRTRSQQAAASDGAPVLSFATTDWDRKRWPAVPEMVVMETKPGVSPDTTIQLMIDGELASTPANVRTGRTQEVAVELAPAFFVEKVSCFDACNPESRIQIEFRSRAGVHYESLRGALSVVDITDPAHEVPLTPAARKSEEFDPNSSEYSLDDLGYSVTPAHDYALRIDPSLQSSDGQTLGYAWMTVVHFMHKSGFISFGGGHGVWESTGGTTLPFYARNVKNVQQWLAPLPLESVMPTILLQGNDYSTPPATAPSDRNLAPAADKIQSYGVNLKPLLGTAGKGLAWVAIKQGNTIPKSSPAYDENLTRATLVQVTNLGINVKDSPLNTLVFVTRLDDAAPVAGARVSIRKLDNSVFWTGTTDVNGLVTAPNTDLRVDRTAKKKKPASRGADAGEDSGWEDNWSALDKLHFIVTAEKDDDVAYVASDWHDGVSPWDFDLSFNLGEAEPLLRGTVFSDRGVYKLGEEVHLKAVLRSDTPKGMQLLPAGTKVDVVIQDSHDKEVDKRTIALNDWSSAEFIFKVPADGSLGTYQLRARVEGQRLQTFGDFLVAAYRRPDFRVDATLGAKSSVTGTKLDGRIAGRYLFGGAMSSRPVTWTLARYPLSEVPEKIADRWPAERWVFLSWPDTTSWETVASKDQKLNSKGDLVLSLPTAEDAGMPYTYRLQGEVTDVSRQKIAGNATYRVDAAPWYIGVSKPPYFAESDKGVDT